MDRGVKIAIFVASIVALGLGLIWDQVLSHARVMVETHSDDTLAPELIGANIGSPDIERITPPENLDPQFVAPHVDEQPTAPDTAEPIEAAGPTEYTVQEGDSYWKLAHVTFKDRNLSSDEIKRANGGKELRPGDKFMVPAGNATGSSPTKPAAPAPEKDTSKKPSDVNAATEYTVQDGDSWWKIANVRFKGRGFTSDDLMKANPGVKLVAGAKVKIP